MKIIVFLFIFIFFSQSTMAKKEHTGGYWSKNREIVKIIKENDFFAFGYGLLQRSLTVKNKDFINDSETLWRSIRNRSHENMEEINNSIRKIAGHYWCFLNHEQQKSALIIIPIKSFTGGFKTNNNKIMGIIYRSDLDAFAYGLVRQALALNNQPFIDAAQKMWTMVISEHSKTDFYHKDKVIKWLTRQQGEVKIKDIRHRITQNQKTIAIRKVVRQFWQDLTPDQQRIAAGLNIFGKNN